MTNLRNWIAGLLPLDAELKRNRKRADRRKCQMLSDGIDWLEQRQMLTNTVSISATPIEIPESGSLSSSVTITRSGTQADISVGLQIDFSRTGTATYGLDYTFPVSPIQIPPNMTSVTVLLTAIQDAQNPQQENDETAIISILPSSGYIIDLDKPSVTVTIVDDETPAVPPTVSTISATLQEGTYSNQVVGTVQVDGKDYSVGNLSLSLAADDDAPVAPATDVNGFSVVFVSTANNISTWQLRFTGTLDHEVTPSRKFDLEVRSSASGSVLAESDATVTVSDRANSATASLAKGSSAGTLNASWSATLTPSNYSVQLQTSNQAAGPWTNVPNKPGASYSYTGPLTSTTFTDLGYGYFRIVVTATWTGAGSNGNDISSAAASSSILCSAPPVFDSPPTPLTGSPVSRQACDNEDVDIEILAHDQDSVGSGSITYSVVSGPPGSTIVTLEGKRYVRIAGNVPAGSHSITVRATDDEGEIANRSFTLSLTRFPPATISLTGSVSGGQLFVVSSISGKKDVTFTWSGTNVSSYEWELYEFQENGDGAVTESDMVKIDSKAGLLNSDTSKTFLGVGIGVYLFRVRALNACNASTTWQESVFAIAAMQFVTVNNSEDQCMVCTELPGESPTTGVRATSGDGGAAIDIPGPKTGESIQDFGKIQNLSDTNPHPVSYTKLTISRGVDTTVDMWERQNTGMKTVVTIPRSLAPSVPGERMVSPIVPFQWKFSAAQSVGVASGFVDARVRLSIAKPGGGNFAFDATTDSSNARKVDAPYLNRTSSIFGRRIGIAGMQYVDNSTGTPVLIRGNGTTATFSVGGSSLSAGAGSFIKLTGGSGGWQAKTETGDNYSFDSSGKLTSLTKMGGHVVNMSYYPDDKDGDGIANDLNSVTDQMTGESITYAYAANRLSYTITQSVMPGTADDLTWTYTVNAAGHLVEVLGPVDPTQPTAPRQKVVLDYYDSAGEYLLKFMEKRDTTNKLFERTEFVYDSRLNLTSVTRKGDATHADRVWGFQSGESRLLNGIQVLSGYDPFATNIDVNTPVTTSGIEDVITRPDGLKIYRTVDVYGKTIKERREYMDGASLTAIKVSVTEYKRNAHGQVLEMKGPYLEGSSAGPITTYLYDSARRLQKVTYPDTTTEYWNYQDVNGQPAGPHQPKTYRDRVGHVTVYGYNSMGMQSSAAMRQLINLSSLPENDANNVVNAGRSMYTVNTTYTGDMIETQTFADPNGQGGDAPAVKYYYDSATKMLLHTRYTTQSQLASAPTSADRWISQSYDSFGNLASITKLYQATGFTGGANGVPSVVPVTVRTDFTNSVLGGVRSMTLPDPDGPSVRPVYEYQIDAWLNTTGVIAPGPQAVPDRTTIYAYNPFGEVLSVASADPDAGTPDKDGVIGSQPLQAATTWFTYDLMGNVRLVEMKTGTIVQTQQYFAFNSESQLMWQSPISGSGVTEASTYNYRTFYEYDAAGRMTRTWEPGSTTGPFRISAWQYNDTNNTVTFTDSATKVWTSTFDAAGRLLQSTTPAPNTTLPALTTSYQYIDGDGGGVGTDIEDGRSGNLVRVTDSRNMTSFLKYNYAGQLLVTAQPDPDGLNGPLTKSFTTNVYDSLSRLDQSSGHYGSSYSASLGTMRTTDYSYEEDRSGTSLWGERVQITTPDPDGPTNPLLPQVTEYQYDQLGRIVRTILPSTLEMTYQYRTDGLLGVETRLDKDADASNDLSITYDYDNWGRMISETRPSPSGTGTSRTNYTYNQQGLLSQIFMPAPDSSLPNIRPVTTYTYAANAPGLKLQTISVPASNNGVEGQAVTKFVYDTAGRMIEQYRPDPATGNASTTATEKWTYDSLDRISRVDMVKSTGTGYDFITYGYDSVGRVTSVGEGLADSTTGRRERYTYAANGDLQQYQDPRGQKTRFQYDDWGRQTAAERLKANGTVNDSVTTSYDDRGRVLTSKQVYLLGSTWTEVPVTYGYDNLDRLKSVTDGLNLTEEWFYDQQGFLDKYENKYNQPTYYNYDAVGRLTETFKTKNLTGAGTKFDRMQYQYNSSDQVKQQTDAFSRITMSAYDSLGRLKETQAPAIGSLTAVTSYEYDLAGNLTRLTDPDLEATNWKYDFRGRTTSESVTVGTSTLTRTYQYWANDNLKWSQDRNGKWTRYWQEFAFGAPGNYRTVGEDWWTSGTSYEGYVIYGYDEAVNNGLTVTDVKTLGSGTSWSAGQPQSVGGSPANVPGSVQTHVHFDYDELARVSNVRDFLGGNGDLPTWKAFDTSYKYDGLDRRTQTTFTFVNETSGTNPVSNSTNTYEWHANVEDRLEWVRQVTTSSTGVQFSQTDKRVVKLEYYNSGELKKISRWEGSVATADALVTDYALADQGWIEGRVGSITHSNLAGTVPTQASTWTYDVGGRTSTALLPGSSTARTYNYDNHNQLTSVTGSETLSRTWDANGNRTDSGVTVADNRLINDGTYTYDYDNEGNRIKRTNNVTGKFEVYTWDRRNRLTKVRFFSAGEIPGTDAADQTIEYAYDGLDRRIRRRVDANGDGDFVDTASGDVQERFVYDTNVINPSYDEVVQVLDESNGTYAMRHRYLNGPLLDQVFSDQTADGNILWLLQDRQQTVTDVADFGDSNSDGSADGKATLINHIDYDSFGRIISADNPQTPQQPGQAPDGVLPGLSVAGSPQQAYTGQLYEPLTGLHYYDARWFDAFTNQFISEDPIGFAAGDTNLRRYVGNSNPNATDPSGLDDVKFSIYERQRMGNIQTPALTQKQRLDRAYENLLKRRRERLEQEDRERKLDQAWLAANPRRAMTLQSDGSVCEVTHLMDPSVLASLQCQVIASANSPRRYGNAGEDNGRSLYPGMAAVPLCASDAADVRAERREREKERATQLAILEAGVPGVGTVSSFCTAVNPDAGAGSRTLAIVSLGVDAIPLIGAVTPNFSGSARVYGCAGGGFDAAHDGFRVGSIELPAGERQYFDFISKRTDVDPNGCLDVVVHGGPHKVLVRDTIFVDHRILARAIEGNPQFQGQTIRLLSCNTGKLPDGFAQNLANKMNVCVIAPNKYVWTDQFGRHFVAGGRTLDGRLVPDFSDMGTYITFQPGSDF